MPFYADTDTFYAVMADLFDQVLRQPELVRPLRDSKVVLHIVITQPEASLVLDARPDPPRFSTGAVPKDQATLGLRMPADVLHNVWLGKIRLRDAYLAGQMQLTTSPLKALSLLMGLQGLFRYIESIYPQVLRQRGLLSTATPPHTPQTAPPPA